MSQELSAAKLIGGQLWLNARQCDEEVIMIFVMNHDLWLMVEWSHLLTTELSVLHFCDNKTL